MKKTFITAVVASLLLMSPLAKADDIKVVVNGEQLTFDQPPIIMNGRTLVPMRALFEALGAEVTWDDNDKCATGIAPGVVVNITIDNNSMKRNTIDTPIDVPAIIENGRTLIPLRVVSECFGMDVEWNEQSRLISLKSNNKIGFCDWNDKYFYAGEIENGKPSGYGALYNVNTNTYDDIGIFNSQHLLEGTRFYDDGDIFCGKFVNGNPSDGAYEFADGNSYIGKWSDNGLVDGYAEAYYSDGASYKGNFVGGLRSGKGIYYYGDGSYHDAYWENSLPNGYGVLYNAYYNVSYKGNWTNGKKNGEFLIVDHANNTSHTVYYIDDVTVEANDYIEYKKKEFEADTTQHRIDYEMKQAELQQTNSDAYYKELNELNEWKKQKLEELYEFSMSDPYSYDWAQDILEEYGVADFNETDDNVDSYSAANKKRQQQAYLNSANQVILTTFESKIKNQQKLIEEQYNYELNVLKQKYNIK